MNNINLPHAPEIANLFLESTEIQPVNVELLLLEYMVRAIQKISLH